MPTEYPDPVNTKEWTLMKDDEYFNEVDKMLGVLLRLARDGKGQGLTEEYIRNKFSGNTALVALASLEAAGLVKSELRPLGEDHIDRMYWLAKNMTIKVTVQVVG